MGSHPPDEPPPEDPSPDACRLRFRAFRGSGGAHPLRDLRRLQQLGRGWLRPDVCSREQMLDALVLEQFLLCAPLGLQALVREGGVSSCAALERLLREPGPPRHWAMVSVQGQTCLLRHGGAGQPAAPDGSVDGALDLSVKPGACGRAGQAAGPGLQDTEGGAAPPGTQGHSGLAPGVPPGPAELLEGPSPRPALDDAPTVGAAGSPAVVQPPLPGGPEPECADGGRRPWGARRAGQGSPAAPSAPTEGGACPRRGDRGDAPRSPRRCRRRKRDDSPVPPEGPAGAAAHGADRDLPRGQPGCDPALSPGPAAPADPPARPRTPERAPGPHACGDCPKRFRYRSQLVIHRRSHTGERPFRCPSCPKGFMQASDLRVHLRTHAGLRPFACEACGKRFAHQSTLRSHRRTHTRARPFACEDCGARFGHKGNLNVHRRTHSGARPYLCGACGRAFRQLGTFRRHQKTHLRA